MSIVRYLEFHIINNLLVKIWEQSVKPLSRYFPHRLWKRCFEKNADALTPLLSSSEDFGLKNCFLFFGLLNWKLDSPFFLCLETFRGNLKKNQAARQQTAADRITNRSRPLRMKWYISINNAQIFMKFQDNTFEMFYF